MGRRRESDQQVGKGTYKGVEKEKRVKTTGGKRIMGITIEVMLNIIVSVFEPVQLGLRTF